MNDSSIPGRAIALVAALFLVTACSPEPEAGAAGDPAGHDHDHAAHAAVAHAGEEALELFTENKGVLLPDQLQRGLGVQTTEATEREVLRRLEKPAQVYRAARGGQPAAAVVWLDAAHAKVLEDQPAITLGEDRMEARLVRPVSAQGEVSGRVEALIEFDDPDGGFPVGTTLTARFTAAEPHPSLAVPRSALIHGAAGSFVFARNGEHFSRVTVTTGAESDGWVEITDGLYEGDVVVTKAVEALWLIELCALKGGTPCCPVPES